MNLKEKSDVEGQNIVLQNWNRQNVQNQCLKNVIICC